MKPKTDSLRRVVSKPYALGALLLLLASAWTTTARATYTITLLQEGPAVLASGIGSVNLTELTLVSTGQAGSGITPNEAMVIIGMPGNFRSYSGLVGPASFGSSGDKLASNYTGNLTGVSGSRGLLYLPADYVSGSTLAGVSTFNGTTLTKLGFTPGTYTYTWGSGANADSFVVTSVAPEPSTWAMILGGFAVLISSFPNFTWKRTGFRS